MVIVILMEKITDFSLSPIKKAVCGKDSSEQSSRNEDSVQKAPFPRNSRTPNIKKNLFYISLARPANNIRKKLVLPKLGYHRMVESNKKLIPHRRLNELMEVHKNYGTRKLSIMAAAQAKLLNN